MDLRKALETAWVPVGVPDTGAYSFITTSLPSERVLEESRNRMNFVVICPEEHGERTPLVGNNEPKRWHKIIVMIIIFLPMILGGILIGALGWFIISQGKNSGISW